MENNADKKPIKLYNIRELAEELGCSETTIFHRPPEPDYVHGLDQRLYSQETLEHLRKTFKLKKRGRPKKLVK